MMHIRAGSRAGLMVASLATLLVGACVDSPMSVPAVDEAGDPVRALTNPFEGARLFVDPASSARLQVESWRTSRPADAAALERIAAHPQADWFGDWTRDVRSAVAGRADLIADAGALPLFVAYNIPLRDCGGESGGGSDSGAAYLRWIRDFAAGLMGHDAVVILEPDALALEDCLSAARQTERHRLLRDAVEVLTESGRVSVYLDAGHAAWHPAPEMARRLLEAGVENARGFALNVSNFQTTAASIRYGEAISARVGGKPFIIDTSRNGEGPPATAAWCNPDDRALGAPATARTGHPLVDALVWVKRPGESDGACNGGPPAGEWWSEYAVGLARRAGGTLAYGG